MAVGTLQTKPSSAARRFPDSYGWATVTLIALTVCVSWLPHMNAPLGDSSEGRVLARFGLHVRNFWDLGAAESSFATSMQPYVYSSNYAHHPPLANAFELATSAAFGQGEWQLRLYGYAAGIAALFLLAALLRQLKIQWGPTLLAVGLMAATNFFWIFARMGGGFATSLALAAVVVYLREHERPPPAMVALSAVVGALTVMTSWPAAATAALLGLWLWRRRGFDRVTVIMASSMVAAALLTFIWILNATSIDELSAQTELRTGGTFTWMEFLRKQWFRATELTPSWYRALIFPALGAGVADRRTRWPTLLLLAAPAAWTFGGREGAFNHEFWNMPWMAAIGVGSAALFDALRRWLPAAVKVAATVALAAVLVVGFGRIVTGDAYDKYFGVAADAGRLLERVGPAPGQTLGRPIENIPAARWMAYYWTLQPRTVTADTISEVPPEELVLIRTDLLPAWVPADIDSAVVASEGRYALVPARAIQQGMAGG